jgi:hypothetical protein
MKEKDSNNKEADTMTKENTSDIEKEPALHLLPSYIVIAFLIVFALVALYFRVFG